MTYDRETAQEMFRQRILAAMDRAANEIFGPSVTRNDAGATDEDLPRLFKCLDEQLAVLATRFNHPLYEGYVGSTKYMQERAQLQALGVPVVDDAALK